MTINDEILIAANQVANTGKKPTVALIKARLANPAPLPRIISVLKSWQHDPSFTAIPANMEHSPSEPSYPTNETDEIRKELTEELSQMKQEIAELKLLIQTLIKQKVSKK